MKQNKENRTTKVVTGTEKKVKNSFAELERKFLLYKQRKDLFYAR